MQGAWKSMGLLLVAGILGAASVRAQVTYTGAPPPDTAVQAKGVGIAGGIMAGAETVLLIESIARVKPVWPWLVFPVVGAAGGGVGGYFLEKNSTPGAVALLSVAMAAVIPTSIAVASAHKYRPETTAGHEGDQPQFSFEQTPTAVSAQTGTTTEVEARPEGIPEEGGAPPPVPDAAAPAAPQPEPPATDAPAEEAPTGLVPSATERRMAHVRSGALLHGSARAGFGLGVPAFNVATHRVPVGAQERTGVLFHLAVLRIDLP